MCICMCVRLCVSVCACVSGEKVSLLANVEFVGGGRGVAMACSVRGAGLLRPLGLRLGTIRREEAGLVLAGAAPLEASAGGIPLDSAL